MYLFNSPKKAVFISRPNRFVTLCNLNSKTIKAYLPNTGRLHELFLPGVTVYLEKAESKDRKLPYTLVAVEKNGYPVMLHTHKTNDVAEYFLKKGLVPEFEEAKIIKREATWGKSRFDFLLQKGLDEIYLEVKSCTLFGKTVAMFPDAVTSRGKKHLEELVLLSKGRARGAVLFVVNYSGAKYFLPDFHTDPDFSGVLYSAKNRINVIPLAINWNDDLSFDTDVKLLEIPWNILKKENEDCGNYLLILKLPTDKSLQIGKLGTINFRKGYYIYVGSAKKNLSKRIERHKNLKKKLFWHIDYLRKDVEFIAALPIRTKDELECRIAKDLKKISKEIPGFGCSDCSCSSHLFGMEINPLHMREFHNLVEYYRMDRLIENFPSVKDKLGEHN